MAKKIKREIALAARERARDKEWREATVAAARLQERPKLGMQLDTCRVYWREGRVGLTCKKLRICITCLRVRVGQLQARYEAVLDQARVPSVFVYRGPKDKVPPNSPWRRGVKGHLRLYLPKSDSYIWLFVGDAATLARYSFSPGLDVKTVEALRLLEAPLIEVRELGPASTVARYLLRKKTRMFSPGGLFKRKPTKLKRRGPLLRV